MKQKNKRKKSTKNTQDLISNIKQENNNIKVQLKERKEQIKNNVTLAETVKKFEHENELLKDTLENKI